MPTREPLHHAFIVNPKAGRFYDTGLMDRIEEYFSLNRSSGRTAEIILTDSNGHARSLAAELAGRYGGRLLAVACGGDGTANEVANGIVGTDAAMSVFPIGTSNDFAKTALSTIEPGKLVDRLGDLCVRPIDVIKVDDRICLNITSLGFDTKVLNLSIAITAKCRWIGPLAYHLAIVLAIFGSRQYPMYYRMEAVTVSGQSVIIEGNADFVLAALCNGRYYGNGFNPAPHAEIDDGRLDFCLVDSLPLYRILPLIPKYKKGLHLGDPAIHTWQVTKGTIEARSGRLLGNIDGEPFEKEVINFEIIPGGLNFAFY
ncbi:MAG: diacylglycerol/lipid kinase family protein [Saccharofermentanales bacterium]|nr:hypothetical protein [Clostridiaceae bacterium]